jgi:hypothetical protein
MFCKGCLKNITEKLGGKEIKGVPLRSLAGKHPAGLLPGWRRVIENRGQPFKFFYE